jgi:hypothetical protein
MYGHQKNLYAHLCHFSNSVCRTLVSHDNLETENSSGPSTRFGQDFGLCQPIWHQLRLNKSARQIRQVGRSTGHSSDSNHGHFIQSVREPLTGRQGICWNGPFSLGLPPNVHNSCSKECRIRVSMHMCLISSYSYR